MLSHILSSVNQCKSIVNSIVSKNVDLNVDSIDYSIITSIDRWVVASFVNEIFHIIVNPVYNSIASRIAKSNPPPPIVPISLYAGLIGITR